MLGKYISSICFLPFTCSVVLRTGDTSVMKLDEGVGAGAGAKACSGISTEERKSVYQPMKLLLMTESVLSTKQ